MKRHQSINNLTYSESIEKWSTDYFENDRSIPISELEEFTEIAASSYFKVRATSNNIVTTDTIRYEVAMIERNTDVETVREFAIKVGELIEPYVKGELYQGTDVTMYKGQTKVLVQLLVFNLEEENEIIKRNCLYDTNESWFWLEDPVSACGNPSGIGDLEDNFNNGCYFTQSPLFCESSETYVSKAFRVAPYDNMQWIDVLPCNSWSTCDKIDVNMSSIDPFTCLNEGTVDYCSILEDTGNPNYNFNLFYIANASGWNGCISGTDMNFYQEGFSNLAQGIVQENLYGLNDYSWNIYRGYLEFNGLFGGPYAFNTYIIYWRCAPSFQ